jgi:hypothetical protein
VEGATAVRHAPIEGGLYFLLSFDDLIVHSDLIMNYEDSRVELRAMGHNLVRLWLLCAVIHNHCVRMSPKFAISLLLPVFSFHGSMISALTYK